MSIRDNLIDIQQELLPFNARLVAVSKTQPAEKILELYNSGQRIFGENRVQELLEKYPSLPGDIEWHLIGHLQTNKVKYIAPFIRMIHSVDSLKLLKEINKEALKHNRTIPCLLQFHIASEETKFGLNIDEAESLLESDDFKRLENIEMVGVMGMATNTENKELVRKEFHNLKEIFTRLKDKYFSGTLYFREISMGMSGDYKLALEEGSTLVRTGSILFRSR